MSAPVRIETWVWTDPRFLSLANELDLSLYAAIGVMARVWAEQTRLFAEWQKANLGADRSTASRVLLTDVALLWRCLPEKAETALTRSKLGKVEAENAGNGPEIDQKVSVFLAGEERLWWLADRVRNGSKGGKAKAKKMARPQLTLKDESEVSSKAVAKPKQNVAYSYGYSSCSSSKRNKGRNSGLAVLEASRSVVDAFNATFDRRIRPETFLDNVKRVLDAGYTEAEMRGVVWWSGYEWPPDHEYRPKLSPATLLKLNPSRAGRSFVTYLGLATEHWESVHPKTPVPWQRGNE